MIGNKIGRRRVSFLPQRRGTFGMKVPFCVQNMIRLKVHSQFGYDTFPDNRPVSGEPYIDVWQDNACIDQEGGIALLLEPRSMIGGAYDYCEQNPERFDYIFTHDSRILKKPNAWYLNWSDVWTCTDSEKTKGISLLCSWKNWCPLHNLRLELARHYEVSKKVDVMGTYKNRNAEVSAQAAHEHYRFAIIIENDIDELWFTEKILNCFATKTVPIYIGATRIDELFNGDGIIQTDPEHIMQVVDELDIDSYESYRFALNDNFERVKRYQTHWRDRFFKDYGELLQRIQDGS